eukprot:1177422-Prorocentrum_minimum.AAC.2
MSRAASERPAEGVTFKTLNEIIPMGAAGGGAALSPLSNFSLGPGGEAAVQYPSSIRDFSAQ